MLGSPITYLLRAQFAGLLELIPAIPSYSVEGTSGARFTMFQDLITGQWYRQNWV